MRNPSLGDGIHMRGKGTFQPKTAFFSNQIECFIGNRFGGDLNGSQRGTAEDTREKRAFST